jgi:tetratricopeptide (TPR) repeat protein
MAAADFRDGRLFVDLHGFTPGRAPLTAESALEALLLQIGVSPSQIPDGVDRRAALWRARSAGRRLLVLLDNAFDDDQVRPLLPGSSGIALVLTSRRHLAAVDGAASVPVEVLPDADAAALFETVAGQSDAGVVELCGHLPLAIRIAAARLQQRPQWTASLLAARLGVEHRRLAELRVAGRDVAAAFALSYRELDEAQQRMFRVLGQHPGPDFGTAAAAVAAGIGEDVAERLLEDLLDAHLLRQQEPARYGFHDLLAEHARDIVGAAEGGSAFDRLLDYYGPGTYGSGCYGAGSAASGSGRDAAWHARERANLVAITVAAFDRGRDDAAWRLAHHAVGFLEDRGYGDDHLTVTEIGIAAARRLGSGPALQVGLGDRMIALWEAGRLAEALVCADEQLALIRTLGDTKAEALALARLGGITGMLGETLRARGLLRQALSLAETAGDHRAAAVAWGNLSVGHVAADEIDDALSTALAAEAARKAAGDADGLILARAHLALVRARMGDVAEAVELVSAAVREAVAREYAFGEAFARIDFADILLLAGRSTEARDHAERACSILRHLNQPLLSAMAANSLGTACQALGRSAAALTQHRLAWETARRIGYRAQEVRALAGIEAASAAAGSAAQHG